ncbi:MAG: uroporphyrinogen-III synthase [Gallionellaceae bacterium]|nr:uroporphyrinogen-III synthase [Gallionellaceae bacterium]
MANTPLAGLNIVVTRPLEQAVQLQQGIEQLGGSAILFPLLEISPPKDLTPLRQMIARLVEFNLVIFISPNAVKYGMEVVRESGMLSRINCRSGFIPTAECEIEGSRDESRPTKAPLDLRIAAVGQGSAKALRELGVENVIAPVGQSDSEALLALPELQEVEGWKIAIFRGDGGRELLGDTLKRRGAEVEYVTCYLRSKPQQNIQQLLDKQPQAIIVSSSEALTYLTEMFVEAGASYWAEMPLFVSHERIAATAKNLGWQNIYQTEAGDDGVTSALIAWASEHH